MKSYSLSRLDYLVALSLSAFAFAGAGVTECYETIADPSISLNTFAARLESAAKSPVFNPNVITVAA